MVLIDFILWKHYDYVQWLGMIKFLFVLYRDVHQGGFDGRGQPTASPMLTAIMSGGVGISGRELYKYR